VNLADILEETTSQNPEKICAVQDEGGPRLTYRQVLDRTWRLVHLLRGLSVRKGDRVAVFLTNSFHYLEVYFSLARIGAIVVGMNFRLKGEEAAYILNHCQAKVLILEERYLPLFAPLRLSIPHLFHYLVLGAPAEKMLNYEEMLNQAPPARPGREEMDEQETIGIMYTSGTTGLSKGVEFSHKAIAVTFDYPSAIRPGIILVNVPFYHIAGALNIYTAVYKNSTLVIIPQFDAAKALRLMEKEGVTETYLVPTMLRALLDHPDFSGRELSSLKRIRYGAAPMPPDLILRAIRVLPCDYFNAFGQTETSGTAIALNEEDHRLVEKEEEMAKKMKRLSGIGRPIPEIECRLADEQGKEVPPGIVGEILVRGPKLMKGYWNAPRETARVLKDGWLHTGDMAWRDEDGYLFLADRKKDVINRGGEKIFPAEVESIINRHPKVLESAVIGVFDPYWGEKVEAFIVLQPGISASEEEMIDFCRSRLASYKKPALIKFLPELPKNAVGKVLKYVLRQQASQEGRSK
jgi:acyl-CoA synthetase (AMP-forming)/AMP-acid ligase II